MITEQTLIEDYVSVIENNISDVNKFRKEKSKKWVYDDLPRADITYYPRIAVVSADSPSEPLDVGYNKEVGDIDVQIMIFVKQKQKLTINNQVYRDVQILDYLEQQIITLFKTKNILSTDGLIGDRPILLTVSNPPPTNDGRLVKVLIYKNKFVR